MEVIMNSPIYVAVEGPDGAGKTTLAKAIVEKLAQNKSSVAHCPCPGSTPFGQELRRLIKGTAGTDRLAEQVAMAADFIELNAKILQKKEAEYYILDRANFVSGVMYGHAGGMNTDQLKAYCNILMCANLPKMHVIMPMAHYSVFKQRRIERNSVGKTHDEKCQFEDRADAFQEKVYENYTNFLNQTPHYSQIDNFYSFPKPFIYSYGMRKSVWSINANNPIDVVVTSAMSVIETIVKLTDLEAFY